MSTTSESKKKKSRNSKDAFILGDMKISKDNLLDMYKKMYLIELLRMNVGNNILLVI